MTTAENRGKSRDGRPMGYLLGQLRAIFPVLSKHIILDLHVAQITIGVPNRNRLPDQEIGGWERTVCADPESLTESARRSRFAAT